MGKKRIDEAFTKSNMHYKNKWAQFKLMQTLFKCMFLV